MDKGTAAVPPHVALISGSLAGLGVDIALFPLDTLKTRLQSQKGLMKSGGFKKLWSGIGPVAVGSAPGAAIFFLAYETGKSVIFPKVFGNNENSIIFNHMASATIGEVSACFVRVPVEVIKQRSKSFTSLMVDLLQLINRVFFNIKVTSKCKASIYVLIENSHQ